MVRPAQNRLAQEEGCLFSGRLIERSHPVSFRLNGRTYAGFKGDTVLSALLAGGVSGAGLRDGSPLALDVSCCPPIVLASNDGKAESALPMDRTPVLNGMELLTFSEAGGRGKVRRPLFDRIHQALSGERNQTLDFDFSTGALLPGPWIDVHEAERLRFDLVVVGGGIAGMNAALAAAELGKKVGLVERQPELGGEALFFFFFENEPPPQTVIGELATRLKGQENVTIFTNTLAFSLLAGILKVHRVKVKGSEVSTKVLELVADKTILATGTLERLPVFPGNRLPGVIKARFAFHLGARYGVWPGQTAALCTASSAATRVALLAADLGIKIERLADSRVTPNSRFFEFAKAYGISLVSATQAMGVTRNADGGLSVTLGLSHAQEPKNEDALTVDRLIVCGGWQRDLTLWHLAGGQSGWNQEGAELVATGGLENIVLAGSVSGLSNMTACGNHGKSAVLELFDLPKPKHLPKSKHLPKLKSLKKPQGIQSLNGPARNSGGEFESSDGALPVAGPSDSLEISYLDSGYSFARPARIPRTSLLQRLLPGRAVTETLLTREPRALGLNDVVAKVVLKEITTDFAGLVARERCVESRRVAIFASPSPLKEPAATEGQTQPPDYLRGRFGAHEQVVKLSTDGEEILEVGWLIYPDTATQLPLQAIGVIFSTGKEHRHTALAYMDKAAIVKNRLVVVRNSTHALFARLPDNL